MRICFGALFSWRTVVALLVCCCSVCLSRSAITDPKEVSALQDIKSNLSDPARKLISWNKADPCRMHWIGIECFNTTGKDGYLHIRDLQLLHMNLSGILSPAVGKLSYLEILDFMWNNIHGSIPKEIGNLKSLKLLLLSGNQFSGSLPEELGYLSKLDRLQVDENNISGPLPKSFSNMISIRHLHMNNNSISGQIPSEVAKLPNLVHFLLDNNNLSGHLPPEFSESKSIIILQLDNNNFSGSLIPQSYGKIKTLSKLSIRNCGLHGSLPDLSEIPDLNYLDLSWNHLEGPIPTKELSRNITTIDLSNNKLNGSIPPSYSRLPFLQKISLSNNQLIGNIPSIWENQAFSANVTLILDFQNNLLSNISGSHPPSNVTILLQGNPVCLHMNEHDNAKFCVRMQKEKPPEISPAPANVCLPQSCPKEDFFEYIPKSPVPCYCAAPIGIGYRLKSPGFSNFRPYIKLFDELAHDVGLLPYQIHIDSLAWEEGPRLRMYLKIFPNLSSIFNESEVIRITDMFAEWRIRNSNILGPYELLNFTLMGPYSKIDLDSSQNCQRSAMLKVVLFVSGAIVLFILGSITVTRRQLKHHFATKWHSLSNAGIKIEGVKRFYFDEISLATNNFTSQVGKGGYGNVYRGLLSNGVMIAVKRAQEGSLQGSKEFCNEIEFLSRLHHRNLVSLVGYCDEKYEQMLIYEYMPRGTLRDHLSGRAIEPLDFNARLQIALGSARGILYLHDEVDPPIFHRDIKASNILLDSMFTAKIADFGLSRSAPMADEDGEINGPILTVVRGTPGYIDPEYFLTHKLTNKSDVYSIGVVFLEILTGMPPISHGRNIVREARMAYQRNQIFSILDKRMGSYPHSSVEKFMLLAIRCCDEEPSVRPSIREIVRELEDICMTLGVDALPSESTGTDSSDVYSEYSTSGDLRNLCQSDLESQSGSMSIIHTRDPSYWKQTDSQREQLSMLTF